MLTLQGAVPHKYLYVFVRAKDCFSLKMRVTVDSSECSKNLLRYKSVPHRRRKALFGFFSKEIFGFIFTLLFVFALLVEQLLKVKMKDGLVRVFNVQNEYVSFSWKYWTWAFLKIDEGLMAEVSEIRTGPILNIFLILLFVFMNGSVGLWWLSTLICGKISLALFKLIGTPSSPRYHSLQR